MNITSRQCSTFPQDLSGSCRVAAHTVTSNQDESGTNVSRQDVFVSPESIRQQQQQQQQQQQSPQREGDSDGSSYLNLDAIAIVNASSAQNGSIGLSSVPSEVNIIQNPLTPSSPSKSFSSDPEG